MDQDARAAGTPVGAHEADPPERDRTPAERDRTPEEIRADIEQTRREVGDTAEALAAKTDVKARAHDRIDEVKANVRAKADQIKPSGGGSGEGGGVDTGQLVAKVRANPAPFAIGSAVVFGFLIGRLVRRDSA